MRKGYRFVKRHSTSQASGHLNQLKHGYHNPASSNTKAGRDWTRPDAGQWVICGHEKHVCLTRPSQVVPWL